MAAPTEEDLEQQRAYNERLRQEIAEANAEAADATQAQNRTVEAASLLAETARLEAQLEAARNAAEASSSADKPETGPLAAIEEQLKAAQAGITAPGVVVDTNAENPPEGTTGATVPTEEEPDENPDEPQVQAPSSSPLDGIFDDDTDADDEDKE